MEGRRLLVFTAVTLEARAIRRATAGLVNPPKVEVVGIGAVGLPRQCPAADASLIVMAGLAGALDPALSVGDMVVDDPAGVLPPSLALRRARITTTKRIVATPAEKAALFETTGAAAVEMEQALVFERARAWGVPCVGVRAISDAATDSLDPVVMTLVNANGKLRIGALVGALVRRPSLIPSLRRLGRASDLAVDRLGEVIREIAVAVAGA